MLQRPASTPVWAPVRWLHQRRLGLTSPTSNLLRYVLVAAILTAIGCAYLWQVNGLTEIHDRTVALQREARQLETQNTILAEQLAHWSTPAHVGERSAEEGYVTAAPRIILEPVVAASAAAISR